LESLSSQQPHDCEASGDAGTVLGILLGVAGPAAAVAAWLAITYSYRRSKRRLVLQVGKQLQLKHISYDKDSVSANQHSSPAMVQMTALTNSRSTSQSSGTPWECKSVANYKDFQLHCALTLATDDASKLEIIAC